jgi:hypothetical protein
MRKSQNGFFPKKMIIRPLKKTCLNYNFYYSQHKINKPLPGFIIRSQSNCLK